MCAGPEDPSLISHRTIAREMKRGLGPRPKSGAGSQKDVEAMLSWRGQLSKIDNRQIARSNVSATNARLLKYVLRFSRLVLYILAMRSGLALDPHQPANTYLRADFTIEDGLPDNTVNAILQTRNGFLWVGTDGGLARFDGERFTRIRFRAKRHRTTNCGLEPMPGLCSYRALRWITSTVHL